MEVEIVHLQEWPEGLTLYKNILTPEQSALLARAIETKKWLGKEDTGINRQVQHYGYIYPYKTRSIKYLVTSPEPTPDYLKCLGEALSETGMFTEGKPNQYIINKYLQREGIGAHTDHERFFDNEVATLSLGAEVKMSFRRKDKTGPTLKISLPIGSILVFKDEARYDYTHEIRKADTKNISENSPRISVTFRTVRDEFIKVDLVEENPVFVFEDTEDGDEEEDGKEILIEFIENDDIAEKTEKQLEYVFGGKH